MTRTSKTLKRLGVAGIAIATIGAGVPAFFATAANAATTSATALTISPTTATSAAGTCTPYTVTTTPANTGTDVTTVSVRISQTVAASATGSAATLTFCGPTTPTNGSVAPDGGTAVQQSGAGSTQPTPNSCKAANPTAVTGATTQCYATFTTAPGKNTVTFGVMSDTPGTVSVLAFQDTNGNQTAETFEPQAAATDTIVAATVTAVDCTPKTTTQTVGNSALYTCKVTGANGITIPNSDVKFVITAGPDKVLTEQPCNTTNNAGVATCNVPATNTVPGTDTILFYVNTNTTSGPQTGEPSSQVTETFTGDARNIACAPKVDTPTAGSIASVSCTATDANGTPVAAGQDVQFTETGAGAFRNGTSTVNTKTNASGVVTVDVVTQAGETGDETVTATLGHVGVLGNFTSYVGSGQECAQAAGATNSNIPTAPTTAGNCTDSVVKHWVSGTPSPSPSATSTATTPPAGRQALTLTVNTPVINAGTQGRMTVSGTAGQSIQLVCYTRPSTTYTVARNATIDSAGSPVTFTLALGMNTRCFAQYATNSASGASASNVINVRTVVSIFPVRKSFRNYVFQGHNMPKYAGQLITLYYQSNAGTVRKGYVKTDSTGIYYIPVKFVGSGTFTFFVRTGQTLTNAAGESAHVSVNVH